MKTLCFGSLNIDYVYTVPHFVAAGETLSSAALETFSGGKGLNQSVALARAGAETYHAGAIGADGAFLLDVLRGAGVHTDYIETLPGVRTGHAIIQRDGAGENCILLYGGANRAVTRERIERTLAHFSAGDLLVLQNEISELGFLAQSAKARGMRVALNPSPMDDGVSEAIVCADVLLLNETEAAALLGGDMPADEADAAQALRERNPQAAIVLTLGARGAVYAGDEGVFAQEAFPVRTVDTTGAGDTFTGFFLAGMLEGRGAAQSLRFASAAAALAVTRPGAAPSIPTRVEALRQAGDLCETAIDKILMK